MQEDYLTFPSENLDAVIGVSCGELAYGNNEDNDVPLNFLCSETFNEIDFTEYVYIVVPYCTQDVHIGDSVQTYSDDEDGDDGTTVYHHGAHNTWSVLKYIFSNLPANTLSHIVLTGCSAGGTVLPVAYHLLHQHYNSNVFGRHVSIAVVADSPVYLTPSYFLENSFPHWNAGTIMNKINFPYSKYQYNTDYPTQVWDYVLKKGSNQDKWGFISHTQDPVSLTYYQWMSGNSGDDDDDYNNDDSTSSSSVWYSQLSSSVSKIERKHSNVASFFIDNSDEDGGDDGDLSGHCSFGLYYAFQESGFHSWVANIWKEDLLQERRHSTGPAKFLLVLSVVLGLLLTLGASLLGFSKRQNTTETEGVTTSAENKDAVLLDDEQEVKEYFSKDNKKNNYTLLRLGTMMRRLQVPSFLVPLFAKAESSPTFSGYLIVVNVYFWCMICFEGVAHPLNNPSLGPSAVGLSKFGILNPALVVYQWELGRLFTSGFLCSGVLTYVIVSAWLLHYGRAIEKSLVEHQEQHFPEKPRSFLVLWTSCIIVLGTNLLYCLINIGGGGATCSTIALVLGWSCFSIVASRYHEQQRPVAPETTTSSSNAAAPESSSNNADLYSPGSGADESPYHADLNDQNEKLSPKKLKKSLSKIKSMFNKKKKSRNSRKSTSDQSENDGDSSSYAGDSLSTSYINNKEEPSAAELDKGGFPRPWVFTIVCFLMVSLLLPFNSWLVLLSAMVIGALLPNVLLLKRTPGKNKYDGDLYFSGTSRITHIGLAGILSFLFVLVICRVNPPNSIYKHPFLTGCDLFYTTQVGGIINQYASQDDDDNGRRQRRFLGEDEEGGGDDDGEWANSCAQFCVPHVLSLTVGLGLKLYPSNLGATKGMCQQKGYSYHVLDKTFHYATYSLDVELYSKSGN